MALNNGMCLYQGLKYDKIQGNDGVGNYNKGYDCIVLNNEIAVCLRICVAIFVVEKALIIAAIINSCIRRRILKYFYK